MTREEAIAELKTRYFSMSQCLQVEELHKANEAIDIAIEALQTEPKIGHCNECKWFELDRVAKVDGIPLIVTHEICSRWADGCKTKEDGYCFLFEPQEG